jgi:non-heme chloroperoxidase
LFRDRIERQHVGQRLLDHGFRVRLANRFDQRATQRARVHRKRRQARLEACSRNLKLPTLLVRGGLSDVLSEEGAQSFLALCPHAEYVNVTDAGHMVAGDRNDIFATSVIEFLSRTVPVRGEPVQKPHEVHPHHEGPPGDVNDIP